MKKITDQPGIEPVSEKIEPVSEKITYQPGIEPVSEKIEPVSEKITYQPGIEPGSGPSLTSRMLYQLSNRVRWGKNIDFIIYNVEGETHASYRS